MEVKTLDRCTNVTPKPDSDSGGVGVGFRSLMQDISGGRSTFCLSVSQRFVSLNQ